MRPSPGADDGDGWYLCPAVRQEAALSATETNAFVGRGRGTLAFMSVKRCFRFDWEPSGVGPGSIWTEFCDEEPTRQVECYEGRWFSSRQEYHDDLGPALAEGPLPKMDYGPEDEVTVEEFERAWQAAGDDWTNSGRRQP